MRILVADGPSGARRQLEICLGEAGHEVVCVADADRAWEILCGDPDISLLVTRGRAPGEGPSGLDGMALCRRVRRSQRDRYLPILLLASDDASDDLVPGLHAGADAYLASPLRAAEVQAQLRVAERILELQSRLEARLHDLSDAHARLERHLRAAAAVQAALLPSEPPNVPGIEFAWLYDACELVAGDMFNVFRLDEKHVGLYVLDVSGHGTSAALLSVSLSRVLTPVSQQGGILKRGRPEPPFYEIVSPARVAAELNRRFQLIPQSGQFFTFLYGVLDLENLELRYVRAGHPPPIHVSEGEAVLAEHGGDVPIGVVETAHFEERSLRLHAGDLLLLYTDGVSEARSTAGEEFGVVRMREVLSDSGERGEPVALAVETLRKDLRAFTGGARLRDDVTLVGLGVAG